MASLLFPGGSTTTSGQASNAIRVSLEPSAGEKKSVENRKAKVIACLKNLGMNVDTNNVPQIAVVLSGGGVTAMISALGTLMELKSQNLLDAVTYLPGCSGSTWCMVPLYDKGDWTQNLETIAKDLIDKWANLNFDVTKGLQKLIAAAEQTNYSLTHFWAYLIVNLAVKELNEKKISSHRAICESGNVPYPMYSAADKLRLDTKGRNDPGTWFQNTPHEAGYPCIGAFINSEKFDSKFSDNKLVKNEPELDLCYLQGIWSSALGDPEAFLKIIIEKIVEILVNPYAPTPEESTGLLPTLPVLGNFNVIAKVGMELGKLVKGSVEAGKAVLEQLITLLSVVNNSVSYKLVQWMNNRWGTNDVNEKANLVAILNLLLPVEFAGLVIPVANLLIKTVLCLVGWIWGTTDNFLYKSSAPVPNDLKEKEVRFLVDGGLAINSPCPLILQKWQNVKFILSFEFFPLIDPFLGIKHTADYCKANNIPFPKIEIDPADQSNPKDCYIFEGENVPTVFEFTLFNRVTSQGTVVARTLEYNLANMQYNREQIKTLLNIARNNVRNNSPKIKEKLQQMLTK